MRYIASLPENKIRIVALSTSLANAKDLGEWIGATSHGLFNFPPGVRPVPEIHIQGVDIANFEARMQAMTKPTYTAIVRHAKNGKPALVYVPTRKHVRQTAQDLMDYSNSESGGNPNAENGGNPSFLLRSLNEIEPFIEKISNEKLQDALRHGVGFLHKGLNSDDQDIVSALFEAEYIQLCVISSSLCWGVPLSAHLVVVMGTQYYDSRENLHTDYPVADLLQMIGHACRRKKDDSGKCVILCHAPRKEYYKKFLYEALPVESHFHHYPHDVINAEVVAGVINNQQDAVDYLTWTFLYRWLTQNPNYYNLQGVTAAHISELLSELVENTLSDLGTSKCIAVENGGLSALNLGMIASYYYISYTTIERFNSSLTSKTKMKGLLEILTHASEYSQLSIRPGEEEVIRRLINHQRFSFENPNCTDPHVKANALLQAHFARHQVAGNLSLDQHEVLLSASRLLQAMVDVISSNGWLNLSLLAMEISQMVTQGMWDRDSMLLQLPHFTRELAKRCHEFPGKSIERVSDLVDMEYDERRELLQELLQMSEIQLEDIEEFCKRFPNIEMSFKVLESILGPKKRGWWLVVGDTKTNSLLSIKRVPPQKKSKVKLRFLAPAEAGKKTYTLFSMCDSYLGCDEEHNFTVDVKEPASPDEDDEMRG
ncbi:hypothetical protein M0R45_027887 [Rubus argutus]|uniref:Uncharacterized protein n=1 Tax=Rubus argutus TaxID=59490 RepID=A0AAW1W2T7_RUBAR